MTTQADNEDTETPAGFRVVELSREPIALYKILKFESMVGSGGEAKAAVASGQVLVNGESEIQKRKKIVSGDTIEFGEEKIVLKLSEAASISPLAIEAKTETKPKAEFKPPAKKTSSDRKPISVRSRGNKK
ncbi:MAG: RNA-binding S4 domain-containing protein [Gammaproteobacteria bacterium]|jgi:ribosome-associated protein|nr:RNA-binding S4 domain-containing protein [Gammaproteobacteria bacterium]MBT3858477.1 RNA-binding S4 domain-containing protein [Gammaproteobacteria bacterium]MBT3986785.1 RNA-binding S4 domain-containing protein [Gammaproteobacteria bacterium]MBT4254723.1 RNA-binding S4 domain-containing protein [Gammaproteobacteria bacterium]MBT4582881.1 RNA-binding S4 domain-containing protein [Gammaproteobacteria bacterium]